MNNLLQEQIDLFFEDPNTYFEPPRTYSVLYLLRRDIKTCFGIDANSNIPTGTQAVWPGTMAILAGIDLLGKFFAGNDRQGEVGKRFREFIDQYFQLTSSHDASIIYHLRNALLHSFGLISEDRGNVYRFAVIPRGGLLIESKGNDKYLVDVLTLYEKFENSITKYREDIILSEDLQHYFSAMFPKYGGIHIG